MATVGAQTAHELNYIYVGMAEILLRTPLNGLNSYLQAGVSPQEQASQLEGVMTTNQTLYVPLFFDCVFEM